MDQRPILDIIKDTSKKDRYGEMVQNFASHITIPVLLDISIFTSRIDLTTSFDCRRGPTWSILSNIACDVVI